MHPKIKKFFQDLCCCTSNAVAPAVEPVGELPGAIFVKDAKPQLNTTRFSTCSEFGAQGNEGDTVATETDPEVYKRIVPEMSNS